MKLETLLLIWLTDEIKATSLTSMLLLSGMPVGDFVYANDLVDVLIKMHEANAYKDMVHDYIYDTNDENWLINYYTFL